MLAAASVATAWPAGASAPDPLIEGARLCTQQFPLEEKKNNIPTHLLAAIATTESGRWHEGLGMNVPWPWTINVEGKGYYFENKAQAIAQTRNFLAQGRQSIDVGCMQVNLKHHPKAFADLNQAFDPVTNVAYSAKFLSENYATLGDWIKATAAYHSRTPVHGNRYLGEIERSWNRIVAKVTAARAGKSDETKLASTAPVSATKNETQPRVVSVARPMQEARKVRVIQVRDELRRDSEVMVVRAEAPATQAPAPTVTVADSTQAPATPAVAPAAPAEILPTSNSIRRVSLDKPTPTAVPVPQSNGPQFIFAN